jgi:hypothetical protein
MWASKSTAVASATSCMVMGRAEKEKGIRMDRSSPSFSDGTFWRTRVYVSSKSLDRFSSCRRAFAGFTHLLSASSWQATQRNLQGRSVDFINWRARESFHSSWTI